MKTYTPDQLVILDSGQIDQVQKSIDGDALAFLDDKKEELDFLNPEEQAHLKEYYTDTMEKTAASRLTVTAVTSAIRQKSLPPAPRQCCITSTANVTTFTSSSRR